MKHAVIPVSGPDGICPVRACDDTDDSIQYLRTLLEREQKARIDAEAVAERSWRDLYENQLRLALLQRVTDASNRSSDFKEALGIALAEICAHMNWDLGLAYRVDSDGRNNRAPPLSYTADNERFRPLIDLSRRPPAKACDDLPARVVRDVHPHWIDDVQHERGFPRCEAARACRLQSACAFPIVAADETVAVIEFFSERPLADKDNILLTVTQAATQLARVVERERTRAALLHDARHDAMTGLPNRVLLDDRSRTAFSRQRHSGPGLSMLVIDLDGFKAINDKYGHLAGDALLIDVSRRFESIITAFAKRERKREAIGRITLARIGGDEFAILAEGTANTEAVLRLAHDLLESLRTPIRVENEVAAIGASIGIAHSGPEYASIEQIRRDADLAMYEAKAAQAEKVVIFTKEMGSAVRRRMALERELREAIRDDQFVLHYQPIFCLGDPPQLLGFEALIRWQHPTRGRLDPGGFIPAAEASGLIVQIGEWVLRQACMALARLHTRLGGRDLPFVSINIAAQQFLQPDFSLTVRRAISESGVPPRCVKLEVTEGVAIIDAARTRQVLEDIRMWGVQTSLDDFGTGYSSLSYLKNLPFDSLKIDRSFTASIDDPKSRDIIETILELATKLGLAVVAEGIESGEQDRTLRHMGCTLGQGYHLAPPLDEDAAFALAIAG